MNIHLLSGIQGSGKTTWTNEQVAIDPEHRFAVHRDEIRDNLRLINRSKKYYPVSKEAERAAWIRACANTIIEHPDATDIYFDQTSPTNHTIAAFFKDLAAALQSRGAAFPFFFIVDKFNVDLDEAIARNEKREGYARVPESAIIKFFKIFHVNVGYVNLLIDTSYVKEQHMEDNFVLHNVEENLYRCITYRRYCKRGEIEQ